MGGGEGRVAFSSLLSAQDSRSQITFPPQTELRPCRWTGQRGEGLEETPFHWPECAPPLLWRLPAPMPPDSSLACRGDMGDSAGEFWKEDSGKRTALENAALSLL